jgi:hypothetical protein
VRAEDGAGAPAPRGLLTSSSPPLNQWASWRCIREARQKVWQNGVELQRARITGPEAYDARLAELEELCAARIADLRAPGQVVLRLAISGFGVVLPPQRSVATGRPTRRADEA